MAGYFRISDSLSLLPGGDLELPTEHAAVTNVALAAKLLMSATFMALLWVHRGNPSMFAIFLSIYVIGFFHRKNLIFWNTSFLFFSILTLIFSFGVFGKLEPNSPTGNWLSFDALLFILPAGSSIVAFIAGRLLHKKI